MVSDGVSYAGRFLFTLEEWGLIVSKELNWIEAAQAIEDGQEIQFFSKFVEGWYDKISLESVEKGVRYRIKPREFEYGWYRYNSPYTSEQFKLYTEDGWYGLSLKDNSRPIEVDESKVGEKVC